MTDITRFIKTNYGRSPEFRSKEEREILEKNWDKLIDDRGSVMRDFTSDINDGDNVRFGLVIQDVNKEYWVYGLSYEHDSLDFGFFSIPLGSTGKWLSFDFDEFSTAIGPFVVELVKKLCGHVKVVDTSRQSCFMLFNYGSLADELPPVRAYYDINTSKVSKLHGYSSCDSDDLGWGLASSSLALSSCDSEYLGLASCSGHDQALFDAKRRNRL